MVNAMTDAALLSSIAHVIGTGSDEQMIQVDALAIVANMADKHLRREGAVRENPRETMRMNPAMIQRKDTVSVDIVGASPPPALRRIVTLNATAKSFDWRGRATMQAVTSP